MRLSSLFLAMFCTVAVFAVLLYSVGVNFHEPAPAQGAKLYNPANEVLITGTISEVRNFACPVSEGEIGTHVMVKTADGVVQVHLAPDRIMRSQKLIFAPGEQITVLGSKVRLFGHNDMIARQVTRGNEDIFFRDPKGELLLVQ